MPRFNPDMNSVTAVTPVYPKGQYELKVAKVSPFGYTKDDGSEIFGANLSIKMVGEIDSAGELDRTLEGEDVLPLRIYQHTEGAVKYSKTQVMAILGYARTPDAEDDFNAFIKDQDFQFYGDLDADDEEDGLRFGSGWNTLVGRHFIATLKKEERDDGSFSQDYGNFLPLT